MKSSAVISVVLAIAINGMPASGREGHVLQKGSSGADETFFHLDWRAFIDDKLAQDLKTRVDAISSGDNIHAIESRRPHA